MVLFYSNNIQGDFAFFEAEECRHIQNALRKRTGDQINFVDGLGTYFEGSIVEQTKQQIKVQIEKSWQKKPPRTHLHLAIAPTKQIDRIEWFVEKAVEIGVQEISFLRCKHSERKHIKMDRIERIAIAAMKQSLKSNIPKLNPLQDFDTWLTQLEAEQAYIATLHPDTKSLSVVFQQDKSCCIAIGPEGGFRIEEIELAAQYGVQSIALGRSRLRTETAGIYALSLFHFLVE